MGALKKTPKTKAEPLTDEAKAGLDAKVTSLKDMRLEAKGLEEDIKSTQAELLDAFRRHGITTWQVKEGRKKIAGATFQQQTREVVNQPKLKKRLGSKLWNKVTRRMLDDKLLAQAIKDGEVSAADVAACSDTVPNNPFIRTS